AEVGLLVEVLGFLAGLGQHFLAAREGLLALRLAAPGAGAVAQPGDDESDQAAGDHAAEAVPQGIHGGDSRGGIRRPGGLLEGPTPGPAGAAGSARGPTARRRQAT